MLRSVEIEKTRKKMRDWEQMRSQFYYIMWNGSSFSTLNSAQSLCIVLPRMGSMCTRRYVFVCVCVRLNSNVFRKAVACAYENSRSVMTAVHTFIITQMYIHLLLWTVSAIRYYVRRTITATGKQNEPGRKGDRKKKATIKSGKKKRDALRQSEAR